MDLSPETAAQVAAEIKTYREMNGLDSAAMINRSALAELAEAHRRAMVELEYESARADKAERREAQFTRWWGDVSKQLRDVQREWQAEKHARICDSPDDCRH